MGVSARVRVCACLWAFVRVPTGVSARLRVPTGLCARVRARLHLPMGACVSDRVYAYMRVRIRFCMHGTA